MKAPDDIHPETGPLEEPLPPGDDEEIVDQDVLRPPLPDLETEPMDPLPGVSPGPDDPRPPLAAPGSPSESPVA